MMMPLPQLLDGLGRGRLEVVEKALSLHRRAFRKEFLMHLSGSSTFHIDEHVTRMTVLFETILNHSKTCQKNPTFVQSVLKLTIHHINALGQELQNTKFDSSNQQKRAVLELLDFHLNHLKKLLQENSAIRGSLVESTSQPQKVVTTAYVHSSSTSGPLVNTLSSTLTFKSDEDVVKHALLSSDAVACAQQILLSRGGRSIAQIAEFIQSVADAYITDLLLKKQMDAAKDVLRNTDRDIWPALKAICLNTVDSNIRDYLALELNSISLLEHVEIDAWKFLILVDGIIKNVHLEIEVKDDSLRVVKYCDGESYKPTLSIAVLLILPSSARSTLLTELYFETLNGTLEPMLVKDECWTFLLTNDRLEILIKWIYLSCSENSESGKPDRLSTFLSLWNVTQEMIDYIPKSKCSRATKEGLLDYLSTFKRYMTEESSDVHKLLTRCIRTSQIFERLDEKIEQYLVEFCSEFNLPDLLVSCDIDVNFNVESCPWMELYSQCKTLTKVADKKSSVLDCIVQCASYLKIPKFGNHWISLASFVLSDQTLQDALNDQEENKGQVLSELLGSHPLLFDILTKTEEERRERDISLQSLLTQKYSADSRYPVLKRQSLCRMFKDDPEEELVDFSHDPLILSHGHHEALDFKYYVKQGRPCFASMLVLSEVICNFGKPSRKLLKKASLLAHELAYYHITDRTVTASCIAVLEMLGETSLTLRTHVATVNHIMPFFKNGLFGKKETKEPSVFPWDSFISGEQAGLYEIFDLLCRNLPLNIHMQGLAVQFARIHELPLPKGFLTQCARNNDWFSFLLYSQIYNYPPDVIKPVIKQFQSVALRKHLESFLASDSVKMRPLLRLGDSSKHKISPQCSIVEARSSKVFKQSTNTSCTHTSAEPLSRPVTLSCMEDDVLGVLLACHDCAEPAEALLHACVVLSCPVLAVMADFYQANHEAQLVSWLVSWFPEEERASFECWQKNTTWPPETIEIVIVRSLELSISNLLTAFQIFLPEHPLVMVLEVITKVSSRNLTHHVETLHEFKKESLTLSNEEKNDEDSWCLQNASFVLNIGNKLLLKSLECVLSMNSKLLLLQVLCEADIPLSIGDIAFDPSKLLAMLDILSSTEVQLNVRNYFKDGSEEIHRCITVLMSLKLYQQAINVSSAAFVDASSVEAECMVLLQTDKFQQWLGTKYQDFRTFCVDCNSCFKQAKVDSLAAFHYFHSCTSNLQRNEDRWRALHYAMKWLHSSKACPHENEISVKIERLEVEMWQYCMSNNNQSHFNVLGEELEHSPLSAMCSEALEMSTFNFTEEFHQCNKSCEKESCPVKLMNCLLDIGDILSANRVGKLFQSTHKDLEILEVSIGLAEEKLDVEDIPSTWALYTDLPFKTISNQEYLCNKSLGIQRTKTDSVQIQSGKHLKVLLLVQELCKLLEHGRQIGKQLIACYRIAINLDLTYKEVITVTNPVKLLRTAISQAYCGDYSVVSDIMTALRLSPSECAEFLSREIIAAISKGNAQGNVKEFLLWGHDMEQNFQHLLHLVPDPILLGNELINMISKLAITEKSTPKAVLNTAVELLVRAHDCYATGCHMEGISKVLWSVSSFTLILKARCEWALMVRLLTGIQRYTEMNYIFKMLKENDQFEFLLRKDSVKPLGFKLALLDWLRRECPHDTALMKMTAAHFKMHKEEAELWQKEGNECLHDLVKNGLANNQKTKLGLQTALQDFSHASECYLQADLLNHAMTSAHQAELIALQLHLLSSHSERSVLQVILLDSKSISKLIVSTLSFDQALIVARAYNHRTDWAAALFYHCISPGLAAEEYFAAWSSCMELTPSLVQNIAYRLQRTSGITREMTSNMRWLLGHVEDMDVRYKIASELGLKDMVESLLQAPEVSYLKDTVWQSGFKR